LNEPFQKALQHESDNRRLASLRLARPLLGQFVVALTWRHVMELSLAGNAFFTGREPTAKDFYLLLWRLNPAFRRPDGIFPNLDPRANPPGRIARVMAQINCYRIARLVNPNVTERIVRQWISDAYQDQPSPSNQPQAALSSLSPRLDWFDSFAAQYHQVGYLPDQIFDLPVAWCFQMLRVEIIQAGKEETLIPPSAALFGEPLALNSHISALSSQPAP
jgi:hypothetical protein